MNNLSFVGTTHLDINYSISNLVYSTSNILESHIYSTSNFQKLIFITQAIF
jgi:hypothetical protein